MLLHARDESVARRVVLLLGPKTEDKGIGQSLDDSGGRESEWDPLLHVERSALKKGGRAERRSTHPDLLETLKDAVEAVVRVRLDGKVLVLAVLEVGSEVLEEGSSVGVLVLRDGEVDSLPGRRVAPKGSREPDQSTERERGQNRTRSVGIGIARRLTSSR